MTTPYVMALGFLLTAVLSLVVALAVVVEGVVLPPALDYLPDAFGEALAILAVGLGCLVVAGVLTCVS
jgi:hypothetical protein